jgi:hypothetical protein
MKKLKPLAQCIAAIAFAQVISASPVWAVACTSDGRCVPTTDTCHNYCLGFDHQCYDQVKLAAGGAGVDYLGDCPGLPGVAVLQNCQTAQSQCEANCMNGNAPGNFNQFIGTLPLVPAGCFDTGSGGNGDLV